MEGRAQDESLQNVSQPRAHNDQYIDQLSTSLGTRIAPIDAWTKPWCVPLGSASVEHLELVTAVALPVADASQLEVELERV